MTAMDGNSLVAKLAVIDLVHDYVACIDGDRLEEWPEFFLDDGVYEIYSRENMKKGMSLPLLLCANKDMIADRVTALRRGNIFALHYDRHCISNIRVVSNDDGAYAVAANYSLYHTDLEGESRLFSIGQYDMLIVPKHGELKIKRHTVVVDTFAVVNHISTPI